MIVVPLLDLSYHRLLDPYANPARVRHDLEVRSGETPMVRRVIAVLTVILMESSGDVP
jgi:hypothetical protein